MEKRHTHLVSLKNLRTSIYVVVCSLVLLGCQGDSGDSSEVETGGSTVVQENSGESNNNEPSVGGTPNSGTQTGGMANRGTGFSPTLRNEGTVQDVWTFESIGLIQSDGTVRDLTQDIIDIYLPDAKAAVTISDSAVFREFADLKPAIKNSSDSVREHIDVVAGVILTEERQMLAMIATPDVNVGGLIDSSDQLVFDITRLENEIPAGEPLVLDYYFAVTTPSETPDAAEKGIELLTERLADGRFIIQTESPEPGSDPLLIGGNIGTTFEGSLGAGMPAKSQALICRLPTTSGRCGPLCAGRALYDIYKGFEESWTSIEANFVPGTSSSPPPASKCPPGTNCAQAGNDPHLRTFDGLSYSPQAVGEFTAIDYQSANSDIEMQWRFSPGDRNRTVSFITSVAIYINGTRLTVDPNRENVVNINGQAVTFDDMGNPFVGNDRYDANNGIELSAPRGSIYIATDQWSWLLGFSGRGFIADQQWIKVLVSAPRGLSGIQGMFGNADGNPIGDLISKDRLFVVPPIGQVTVADLYERFIDTWRISDGESLFDYNLNESTATFTDRSFPDFQNLINDRDTLLLTATRSQASEADRMQAETVCRLAGVSDQPGFGECVTDVLNTGDFEVANDSSAMMGVDSLISQVRFTDRIDGSDLKWWHVVDRPISPSDGNLIGSESVTLVTSAESDDMTVLTAIDTMSGAQLWELNGVSRRCGATILDTEQVVVQMQSSGDLLLLDAYTGFELDRYVNEGALSECSSQLRENSNFQVFHTTRNARNAFDIVDDTISLRWTNTNDTDPILNGVSVFDVSLVMGDDLYISAIPVFRGPAHLYRIDADTGLSIAEETTRIFGGVELEKAGDDLIVISGVADGSTWLQGIQVDDTISVSSVWERPLGESATDGVDFTSGRIAYNDDGFASWVNVDGARGIARFNPNTGMSEWFSTASSFDNNGEIVALTDGGFAISPFGSDNFVEAYSRDGSFAWSIPYPAGTNFPVGLQAVGEDTISVVSRNEENDATVLVSIGTRR